MIGSDRFTIITYGEHIYNVISFKIDSSLRDMYDVMVSSFKSQTGRSLGRIRSVFHGDQSPQECSDAPPAPLRLDIPSRFRHVRGVPRPDEGPLYGQEEDERLLFMTAAAGGEVPIEDLPLSSRSRARKRRSPT